MDDITAAIRQTAQKLLEEDKVDLIIGFEGGTLPFRSSPCFIRSPDEVERLTWNSSCENNLADYLPGRKERIGIIAKGCDSRAIVGLIQEKQVGRDQLVILGVPCWGMIDRRKVEQALGGKEVLEVEEKGGEIAVKGADFEKVLPRADLLHKSCRSCRHSNPAVYDFLLGDKVAEDGTVDEYGDIREFEEKGAEQRWDYLANELSRCIRCYACRNACPFCYCRECFVDSSSPQWIGKTTDVTDTQLFHLIRALHLAGRCVDCGACERACPMGVDLRMINKKLEEDVEGMFGYKAGLSLEELPPLATYKPEDQQEFIR
ncbi:4Fe-4S dicluster domain-containing protein [Chloroflexota bacterium]